MIPKTLMLPFLSLLLLISSLVNANELEVGSITTVTLGELHPTQPAIGYDQVYYKLGRFQADPKKQFDEICEANGQKGVSHFNTGSMPNIPSSFQCDEAVGTEKQAMKTIVIAPNGQYYLTDGHHTFNAFWQMRNGGKQFKVKVVVAKDYRALPTMTAFWKAMVKDGNTWLQNSTGHTITYQQLPTSLGMANFENDKYRSVMYYSRNVGWDKPKNPVPFLEFYWSKEVRKGIDLNRYDLTSAKGYRQAITDVSHYLLNMKSDNIGGSGKTAKEMGQFESFNQKVLTKLFNAKKGKVTYMLAYKNSL
ncbi:ParB/Srx family N-terminal domain-containing protein [Marinomonas sp. NPDC078689]|uniref:ParB/Srx family N-terminal domain-containing protein n=1 Tax=Marinomonas sp. NPDC078689 TaxID=3364147 RepID=UPI0037CB87C2